MRTATTIGLVLMGGGALAAGTTMVSASGRACREAQAHNDPRAAEICQVHSSGGHYLGTSHYWSGSGYSSSTPRVGPQAVSRGGFGLSGFHFGGGLG